MPSFPNKACHEFIENEEQPGCDLFRMNLVRRRRSLRVHRDVRPRSDNWDKGRDDGQESKPAPCDIILDVRGREVVCAERPEVSISVKEEAQEEENVQVGDELTPYRRARTKGKEQEGKDKIVSLLE